MESYISIYLHFKKYCDRYHNLQWNTIMCMSYISIIALYTAVSVFSSIQWYPENYYDDSIYYLIIYIIAHLQ